MVKALLVLFKGQEASHLTSQACFTKPRGFLQHVTYSEQSCRQTTRCRAADPVTTLFIHVREDDFASAEPKSRVINKRSDGLIL